MHRFGRCTNSLSRFKAEEIEPFSTIALLEKDSVLLNDRPKAAIQNLWDFHHCGYLCIDDTVKITQNRCDTAGPGL